MAYQPLIQARYNDTTKHVDMGKPWGDFWYDDADSNDPDVDTLSAHVPWLARGVEMRCNAVASMPFRIMRGDNEIDTSTDYKNVVGFLPNPARVFFVTEAALSIHGACYYWNERNRVALRNVRYVLPETIEPIIDAVNGLTGFIRWANGARINATLDDITWFWKPDAFVEVGPPQTSPVKAALAAAGVLHNLDEFAAAFFKRGAIRATLLTVEGNPSAAEKDRLKTWWHRMLSGIKNAFATEIISSVVTPVTIGDGLAELSNTTLTEEKREDIAVALGVPQSVIFSKSSQGLGGKGVSEQDDRHFYDKTIVPECRFIQDVYNEQLLEPLGYRLEFLPQTLDVFQADENLRSTAFSTYVNAGIPRSVAAEMLGLELPTDWTYERLDEVAEERQAQMAEQMQPAQEQEPDDDRDRIASELRAWRRKSKKRGKLAPFESEVIPVDVMAQVKTHDGNGYIDALDGVIVQYTQKTDAYLTPEEMAIMETVAGEYVKASETLGKATNGVTE